MKLSTGEINPRLLKCGYFNGYEMPQAEKMAFRTCYDYELEYYIKSNGGIFINGEYTPFNDGEINFRKPGQVVCGYTQYECYIVCISMKGDVKSDDQYIFGSQKNCQPLYENPILNLLPNKLSPSNSGRISAIFSELYRLAQSKNELYKIKSSTLLYELIYELASQCDRPQVSGVAANRAIKRVAEEIKQSFCEKISIAKLTEKTGLSKAYFHRCFKEYTGKTPIELITYLRMEKAMNLLCMTDNKISTISELCGYDDDVYFTHMFKKATGMTPTKFRTHISY